MGRIQFLNWIQEKYGFTLVISFPFFQVFIFPVPCTQVDLDTFYKTGAHLNQVAHPEHREEEKKMAVGSCLPGAEVRLLHPCHLLFSGWVVWIQTPVLHLYFLPLLINRNPRTRSVSFQGLLIFPFKMQGREIS